MALLLADPLTSGFITGQQFVVDGGTSHRMHYPEPDQGGPAVPFSPTLPQAAVLHPAHHLDMLRGCVSPPTTHALATGTSSGVAQTLWPPNPPGGYAGTSPHSPPSGLAHRGQHAVQDAVSF